ncbi:MAG TPA: putative collagen-binding domain-containing protein [Verrucomicrobiota bacterium]|nr:putative collagen-binding domain-containing protein [Verrucomicrobiota bacterium]HNT14068.1 putative collagen-binding domain-containing protein [Verrucomicrobiota bacterium]
MTKIPLNTPILIRATPANDQMNHQAQRRRQPPRHPENGVRHQLKTAPFALLLRTGILGWSLVAVSLGLAGEKVRVLTSGPSAGHYLTWRGRPLLLVGDSVTQGWMECGTNFDQAAYVEALARRGINLLLLWAYKGTNAEMQSGDRRLGYDAPELWPWPGGPDAANFNLQEFHPLYFHRLKALVAHAESRGIIVSITVHDGWAKQCFAGHPFNQALGNGPLSARWQYVELADYDHELPERLDATWNWRQRNQYFQERFCARLIGELAPFSNVVFEMFNEGEWYAPAARRRHEQHFLAFFRARCDNLLLSNTDGISGDDPHRDPKVDVITLHPQGWTGNFPVFAKGFHTRPPRPYLCSEPVPEFDGGKPFLDEIRRSVWETTLAGAGWVNQNDSSFGWDLRAAIADRMTGRDQAYDLAGHCARFFHQSGVRFWQMQPAGQVASTGICLAASGEEYVIYSPTSAPFTVNLSAAPHAKFKAQWLNPATGEFPIATVEIDGGEVRTFQPPGPDDAVLHLRRLPP